MGKNEARRQKQLAKKKSKRTEKRALISRETSKDPTIRFASAADWPVHETLMGDGLWSSGMGYVNIARQMPGGGIAMASFLVDVYCLGVKSSFYKIMSAHQYAEQLAKIRQQMGMDRVTPEYAAKLVTQAVAFAATFGFAPDVDYRHCKLLFAGIDPDACPDQFTFGKDGKPYYIRGPYETLSRAQSIAHRVSAAGGSTVMMMDEHTDGPIFLDGHADMSHPRLEDGTRNDDATDND